MTTRLTGVLAAGALVVGILVGAAGAVLVGDVTRPTMAMEPMGDMARTHEMMEAMGSGQMGWGGSMDPTDHAAHHRGAAR